MHLTKIFFLLTCAPCCLGSFSTVEGERGWPGYLVATPSRLCGREHGHSKVERAPSSGWSQRQRRDCGKTGETKEVKVVQPQMVLGARAQAPACVQHVQARARLIVLHGSGTIVPTKPTNPSPARRGTDAWENRQTLAKTRGRNKRPPLAPCSLPMHTCADSQEEAMRSPGD